MELKTWLEAANYKITEGYNYGWKWAGNYAYVIASNSNTGYSDTGYHTSVLFDTNTQKVYCCETIDYSTNTAYRYFTENSFKDGHASECKKLGVEDVAYDQVKYIDLEVENDFFEKTKGIIMGVDFDRRVQVPLELEDNEIFRLMKMAHEQDITLNQLVENILKELIKENSRQS